MSALEMLEKEETTRDILIASLKIIRANISLYEASREMEHLKAKIFGYKISTLKLNQALGLLYAEADTIEMYLEGKCDKENLNKVLVNIKAAFDEMIEKFGDNFGAEPKGKSWWKRLFSSRS